MTGVLIPLYVYPTDPSWKEVARAQKAYQFNPIIAVINPASGPGMQADPNYINGISVLRRAGVKVLGYIATTYGAKPTTMIAGEQLKYSSWYRVDSWFFDEVKADDSTRDYYANLGDGGFSIGNAGVPIPTNFIGLMDNFVVYENQGLPDFQTPKDFDSKNFSAIGYGLATFPFDAVVNMPDDHYGYIYLTSGVLPNPYFSVPYLWDLLAALFRRSRL